MEHLKVNTAKLDAQDQKLKKIAARLDAVCSDLADADRILHQSMSGYFSVRMFLGAYMKEIRSIASDTDLLRKTLASASRLYQEAETLNRDNAATNKAEQTISKRTPSTEDLLDDLRSHWGNFIIGLFTTPTLKLNQKTRLSDYPFVINYSTSGTMNDGSPIGSTVDVDKILNKQKEDLAKMSIDGTLGNLTLSVRNDEGEIAAKTKLTDVKINSDGSVELSGSSQLGNTVYKATVKISPLGTATTEMSVTTVSDNASITSTVSMEPSMQTRLTQPTAPVEVYANNRIAVIDVPDAVHDTLKNVNWDDVLSTTTKLAVGSTVVVGGVTMVVVAAGSGGTAALALASLAL